MKAFLDFIKDKILFWEIYIFFLPPHSTKLRGDELLGFGLALVVLFDNHFVNIY